MTPQTRLFVTNIPENANESDLCQAFSSFGEITNLDIKRKCDAEADRKKIAFITLSGSHYDVDSCITYFSNEDFKGNRLYVTRARESFLERLQRERDQTRQKDKEKNNVNEHVLNKNPVINLSDKLNPRKRKLVIGNGVPDKGDFKMNNPVLINNHSATHIHSDALLSKTTHNSIKDNEKKHDSDVKRVEAMKKKRMEFKEKQNIIKSGLTDIDKLPNKKKVFSDNEEESCLQNNSTANSDNKRYILEKKDILFDGNDESGDEINFKIKKHYEGKMGQKVLDLQSSYKSDKRFILDERFIDHSEGDKGPEHAKVPVQEVNVHQVDEKTKQLNILQDVLGVAIVSETAEHTKNKKPKSKLGMLRFDPAQPEHSKFIIPIEDTKSQNTSKTPRKKKIKEKEEENLKPDNTSLGLNTDKIEVSQEQFYKISENLKDSIAQPNEFSLRSLFPVNKNNETENAEQNVEDAKEKSLEGLKDTKCKNPLAPGEKNPFVYDSSESEVEEDTKLKKEPSAGKTEINVVWKEKLFFTKSDNRFKDALAFFNKNNVGQKERRELKSLMKKRIYNTDRKNQMFKKKIGGRKKSMKRSTGKKK